MLIMLIACSKYTSIGVYERKGFVYLWQMIFVLVTYFPGEGRWWYQDDGGDTCSNMVVITINTKLCGLC